ncbi:MAG: TMEM175 family protein [Gemmatimonadaceae bacterium]
MFEVAHEKLRPVLERRDHGFRWRGRDISRIEGLSDAVFGFAITLLVVSLEVPKTFAQLREMMHGFFAFAICFVLLLMIWHAQYIYFRRYSLDDGKSFALNAALLLVVAFYIYPLKFLFSSMINAVTGYQSMENGIPIPGMTRAEWSSLMMIYGVGFIGLYVIFALLYLHAYRLRDQLDLNAMEAYETRGVVQENVLMIGIGVLAVVLAWLGKPSLSGISYALIGPLQTGLGMRHGKRRRELVAQMNAATG